MNQKNSFVISQFTNPSGEIVFRVSGWLDGKRIRKNFPTRVEAEAERQALKLAEIQAETGVRVAATRLTDDQLHEAGGELVARGRLDSGTVLKTYQAVDFRQEQKREESFYQPGQQAFFLRRYGRFAKGESYEIIGANERGARLIKDGQVSRLGYRYVDRVAVTTAREREIAPGEERIGRLPAVS